MCIIALYVYQNKLVKLTEPFWTGLDATKNPKGSLGSDAG